MEDWYFNFPGVATSREFKGDREVGQRYYGEGQRLLYQLKNQMTFRKLGQLKMTRCFSDGTVITASSNFGQDHILIDARETKPSIEFCSITLVDMPEVVQPMRLPGGIGETEVEGVDYIKTYIEYNLATCNACSQTPTWDFTFNFISDPNLEYYDSQPNNHCIISEDGGCHGEVISTGTDENGFYILWKVYTEQEIYNRSGYGFVRIEIDLKNQDTGKIVCKTIQFVKVDCCEKNTLTSPKIYWERTENCASEIYYTGGTALCEVPSPNSISQLIAYGIQGRGEARFYALPELGGCPPYEWTLDGIGSLVVTDPLGRMATYFGPESWDDACGSITISVQAKCGGSDSVTFSYCDYAGELEISYETLIMGCDDQQTLSVTGGYPPYSWVLSGGGGSLEADGAQAIYTAPSSNAGCTNNPTITVHDCCGQSKEVKFAVNCYTPDTWWFLASDVVICKCQHKEPCPEAKCNDPEPWCRSYIHWTEYYRCDNTLFQGCYSQCGGKSCCGNMNQGCMSSPLGDCMDDFGACHTGQCGGCAGEPCPCVQDWRGSYEKAQGCCPINPITGLPF